jgi:hypothetical protein
MSSTIITVGKDPTFKLPQGRYNAVITDYKTKPAKPGRSRNGAQDNGTILFEVFVPGMENYECLARKVLPADLSFGSDLREFLSRLLGPEFFRCRSNQAIDLRTVLVGQLCEVILVHAKFDEDRYSFPLVDVESVHPRRPEPAPPQSTPNVRGGTTNQ